MNNLVDNKTITLLEASYYLQYIARSPFITEGWFTHATYHSNVTIEEIENLHRQGKTYLIGGQGTAQIISLKDSTN